MAGVINFIPPMNIQLKVLLEKYPDLHIKSHNTDEIYIEGKILVCREAENFILKKEYELTIIVPQHSDKLPHVIESADQIDQDYHHRYTNGMLCLDTDSSIRLRFFDGFNLLQWMIEYVEVYFFSYEYYQRYLTFPFGERAHGIEGILQTYQDILGTANYKQTYLIMEHIATKEYRGHQLCPCGGDLKTRKCHGTHIIDFYINPIKHKIISDDYVEIKKDLQDVKRRNSQQTK